MLTEDKYIILWFFIHYKTFHKSNMDVQDKQDLCAKESILDNHRQSVVLMHACGRREKGTDE